MRIPLSKVVLKKDVGGVPFVDAQDTTLQSKGGHLELDTELHLVITHPLRVERGEQLIPCEAISYMQSEKPQFSTIQGARAEEKRKADEVARAAAEAAAQKAAEEAEKAKAEEIAKRVAELVKKDESLATVDPDMLNDAVEKQLDAEKAEEVQAEEKLEAADKDDTVKFEKDPATGAVVEVRGRARFADKK